MHLPAHLAISARSRKFYDGTYVLGSEDFTDDAGLYRAYDCYDPAARAPTPLPPMFSDDEGAADTTPSSRESGEQAARAEVRQGGYDDDAESLLGEGDGGRRNSCVRMRAKIAPKKAGDASSPLSDCPSDLSDWEGEKDKKTTRKNRKMLGGEGGKDSAAKRMRGVAQKVVRKTPRKAAPVPALVARQQDTVQQHDKYTPQQDESNWRRRSTRRTTNSRK